MTEVLHSSSSSSSPSSISTTPSQHGTLFQTHQLPLLIGQEREESFDFEVIDDDADADADDIGIEGEGVKDRNSNHLSLIALLVALFRKSFVMACSSSSGNNSNGGGGMEIGWPTNVQHVAHVTFDRFNGFLGLPVEFEPEVPRRAPSASTTVFGVSTESMQLSFDSRGNSVPTILLLMQRRLYAQGGLQAEGIFRITAGNSQEEYVRDQLNRGVVPDGIDVHCLAGLIKAWFRELPRGVLDPLSPEQVMQCQSEEDCLALLRLLPPTEAALVDWAINLMADVVQAEHLNKMNARNIATVFAPNMTQMADPLTALMYAVQVMNFLKTLIERTLREREDSVVELHRVSHSEPTDEDGHPSPSQLHLEDVGELNEVTEHVFVVEEPESDTAVEEPDSDTASDSNQVDNTSDEEFVSYSTYTEESDGSASCEAPNYAYVVSSLKEASAKNDPKPASFKENTQGSNTGKSSVSNQAKFAAKIDEQQIVVQAVLTDSKCKGVSDLSHINSMTERVEAWW